MQHNRQQLLPVTIDPGGNFGPLATQLLWGPDSSQVTTKMLPSPWEHRTKTHLCDEVLLSMCQDTLEHSPKNILHKDDVGWHIQQGDLPFTRHDNTPGHWGHHVIAHNTNLTMTLHLQQALSSLNAFDATGIIHKTLITAATIPTYRPTHRFPFTRQFSILARDIT